MTCHCGADNQARLGVPSTVDDEIPMMVRGGGDPRQAWLARRLREWACRLGALPPMRMTASWFGSAWNPPNTSVWRDVPRLMASSPRITTQTLQAASGAGLRISKKGPVSPFILPSRAQASRRCETQASAKAGACRQAALAFRSLDASRALQEPDRRRRDEERPSRSEQRTISKPKEEAVDRLTGQPPGKATVTIDNRRSAFSDNPLPRPPAVQLR